MPVLPLPKAKAKLLRKLEQRKSRQELRLYVVEGYRSIHQIVQANPSQVQFILRSESCKYDALPALTYEVVDKEFSTFSFTEHSQGIIAVVEMPKEADIKSILESSNLILALDAIQDPGNLGTIIRNAIWFGVDALFLGIGTVDVFNPKVVRSAMSNLHALPILHGDLSQHFSQAEQKGWTTYLLRLDDQADQIHQIEFPKKTLLVIGNEGNGISSNLITEKRKSVFIPSYNVNDVESLNASVASAIALQAYRLKHP